MHAQPGTYALILHSYAPVSIEVGRWGILAVHRGYYVYVGSAFGPGGLRARVGRHCRTEKRRHWHIDYLRACTRPDRVWYSHSRSRLEHLWAGALTKQKDLTPIEGFGCSDCNCIAHLFFTRRRPARLPFADLAGTAIRSCSCNGLGA